MEMASSKRWRIEIQDALDGSGDGVPWSFAHCAARAARARWASVLM